VGLFGKSGQQLTRREQTQTRPLDDVVGISRSEDRRSHATRSLNEKLVRRQASGGEAVASAPTTWRGAKLKQQDGGAKEEVLGEVSIEVQRPATSASFTESLLALVISKPPLSSQA
jgi:hypothetical protein